MTYYYLATSLTPLEFGDKPDISFQALCEKFSELLPEDEMTQLKILRMYFDLENIKRFFRNEKLDSRGNLNEKELEQALQMQEYFPGYVFEYLVRHKDNESKVQNFPELLSVFFYEKAKKAKGFLKDFLEFERRWRLVLVGYRSKHQKTDAAKQLAYEEQTESIVSSILSQKDSPHFEAPTGYEGFYETILSTKDDPMMQFTRVLEFRFRFIKERIENTLFSLDFLLGYAMQVALLEDLHALNKEIGETVLNTILKDTHE